MIGFIFVHKSFCIKLEDEIFVMQKNELYMLLDICYRQMLHLLVQMLVSTWLTFVRINKRIIWNRRSRLFKGISNTGIFVDVLFFIGFSSYQFVRGRSMLVRQIISFEKVVLLHYSRLNHNKYRRR